MGETNPPGPAEFAQTPPTEFDHYGISVRDLARSVEFYRDVLGGIVVLPPQQVDQHEFSFRRAIVWIGSMGIDLNEHAMNPGETFSPVRTGLDHLAFNVSSKEDLAAWATHLDAKGVVRSRMREVEGVGEAFDFRDPDGIQIELWHRDHTGRWAGYVQKKLAEASSNQQG